MARSPDSTSSWTSLKPQENGNHVQIRGFGGAARTNQRVGEGYALDADRADPEEWRLEISSDRGGETPVGRRQ
jgi:hypothetical protein